MVEWKEFRNDFVSDMTKALTEALKLTFELHFSKISCSDTSNELPSNKSDKQQEKRSTDELNISVQIETPQPSTEASLNTERSKDIMSMDNSHFAQPQQMETYVLESLPIIITTMQPKADNTCTKQAVKLDHCQTPVDISATQPGPSQLKVM